VLAVRLLGAILLALAVAGFGFAMPLMLSLCSERNSDETETNWPGATIDFTEAISRARVISVARVPSHWRDEEPSALEGRYRQLDVTVKWYVKSQLARPSPAYVEARTPSGAATVLPSPGLDRIVFFESGSSPTGPPMVFKIAQVRPERMSELRRTLPDTPKLAMPVPPLSSPSTAPATSSASP
jgi:hypothetical protein